MSILVALLRDDFVALISDSRAVRLDGSIDTESSEKVWRIDQEVILGACGNSSLNKRIVSLIQLKIRDMWPYQPKSFLDYASILHDIVRDVAIGRKDSSDPTQSATFILGGKCDENFQLRSFCIETPEKGQVIPSEPKTQVYVLPPLGLTEDDFDVELHSILHRENLQIDEAEPQQLVDACIEAIGILSARNQYINSIPQVQIVT